MPDMNKPTSPDRKGASSLPPPWFVNTVMVVILIAWIVSLVIRMIWPDRALPPVVDALMLMVAGFLFAGNIKNRISSGGDDE